MCSAAVQKLRSGSTISAVLPSGWEFKESYTFLAPDRPANVIFSTEPLPADMDSRAYAFEQGVLLKSEFPGFEQRGPLERFPLGGLTDGLLRIFSWSPRPGEEIHQIQVYAARSGRGYIATATSRDMREIASGSELFAALRSLQVDMEAAANFSPVPRDTDQSEIER